MMCAWNYSKELSFPTIPSTWDPWGQHRCRVVGHPGGIKAHTCQVPRCWTSTSSYSMAGRWTHPTQTCPLLLRQRLGGPEVGQEPQVPLHGRHVAIRFRQGPRLLCWKREEKRNLVKWRGAQQMSKEQGGWEGGGNQGPALGGQESQWSFSSGCPVLWCHHLGQAP